MKMLFMPSVMENQNDLRPNLFQEVAANVQEGKKSRGKNHLSIKQVHSSKQTSLASVVVA